jgi:hypothetical protein
MKTLAEVKKDLKGVDVFRLQIFIDQEEDYAELMYIDNRYTGREYMDLTEYGEESVDMKKINRLKTSLVKHYGNKIMMEDIEYAN